MDGITLPDLELNPVNDVNVIFQNGLFPIHVECWALILYVGLPEVSHLKGDWAMSALEEDYG